MIDETLSAQAWTFYDERGEITLNAMMDRNSARVTKELGRYQDYVPGVFDRAKTYFANGEPKVRPALAIERSGSLLRGVPAGALITIEDEQYAADGSDIDLSFAFPGTYIVRIRAFPFQDMEFTVENPS